MATEVFPDSETQEDYTQALARLFRAAHELNEPQGGRHIRKFVDEARQALAVMYAVVPLVSDPP